jgi:hypothetical protein
MPQQTIPIIAGAVDLITEIPLTPGLLTHISVSIDSFLLQPGDSWICVNIYHKLVGYDHPLHTPVCGVVQRDASLSWYGQICIEPDHVMDIHYVGYGPTTLILNWSRLTPTYLKALGEYDGAIIRAAQ